MKYQLLEIIDTNFHILLTYASRWCICSYLRRYIQYFAIYFLDIIEFTMTLKFYSYTKVVEWL